MKTLKLLVIFLIVQVSLLLSQGVPDWFAELVVETRSKHGLTTDEAYVTSLYEAIVDVSNRLGIDHLLMIALILVESEFRNVVGMHGELGLTQIKPETASFVCKIYNLNEPEDGWVRLLWDHRLNVEFGALYLKYHLERNNGNILKALEAYNGGNSRSSYAVKVLECYKELMNHSLADR